jgi:hypothetical protein
MFILTFLRSTQGIDLKFWMLGQRNRGSLGLDIAEGLELER